MSEAIDGPPDQSAAVTTRSAFLKRAAATGVAAAATGGVLAGAGTAVASGGKGHDHRGPTSLHDRLNRTSHWDINVADLAKARA